MQKDVCLFPFSGNYRTIGELHSNHYSCFPQQKGGRIALFMNRKLHSKACGVDLLVSEHLLHNKRHRINNSSYCPPHQTQWARLYSWQHESLLIIRENVGWRDGGRGSDCDPDAVFSASLITAMPSLPSWSIPLPFH